MSNIKNILKKEMELSNLKDKPNLMITTNSSKRLITHGPLKVINNRIFQGSTQFEFESLYNITYGWVSVDYIKYISRIIS